MPKIASQNEVLIKIAVPLFKKRVAPYFGSSSKIFLVETQDDRVVQKITRDVGGEGAMEIARRLVDLGVDKLICGGIQNRYKDWLVGRGLTALDNQPGPAWNLIQNLLRPTGREEEGR